MLPLPYAFGDIGDLGQPWHQLEGDQGTAKTVLESRST